MLKGILKSAIQNTVLDTTITLAPAGATVMILQDNGDHYEVSYFDGNAPSCTFYVNKSQVQVIND